MTPYFVAYPGVIGDDVSPPPDSPAVGSDEQADVQTPPAAPVRYTQPVSVSAQIEPQIEASDGDGGVTIIFKDGRPPEQIHNYILTRDILYVGDRHHSDIPVDQLDLTATARVNRDAGVDFHFPDANR